MIAANHLCRMTPWCLHSAHLVLSCRRYSISGCTVHMRPITADDARVSVCLSVCLSACWSHGCGLQKRLNRSRCHSAADSLKEPCIRWGSWKLMNPRRNLCKLSGCPKMCTFTTGSYNRQTLLNVRNHIITCRQRRQ